MNKYFPEVKKNFGFGCMRLPEKDGKIDYAEMSKMADEFIEAGFNYFDTAHGYHDGMSEIAVRECVAKRHKRSEFLLANKLTEPYFNRNEDIRPFFENQLKWCGVDYFDFYLMHSQNKQFFEKFKRCRAYETGLELKKEGKIRHFGISFHDKAEVLEEILKEYPEIEFVQIQFNYVDLEDKSVQAKACYDICRKYGKPIVVMEPVRGGSLANLVPEAEKVFVDLNGGSNASYAIRFAAGQEGIFMVLSGMSNLAQLRDNVGFMKDFRPLDEMELKAVEKVTEIYQSLDKIPCTACRYCVAGCPKKIQIPDIFADYNAKKLYKNWNSDWYYSVHTLTGGKASDCIKCGKCERTCPQRLEIRELLEKVAEEFE